MKRIIWNFLLFIDNFLIHNIFEHVFDNLSAENLDGSDSIYYKIWKNTCHRYCNWVTIDLYDRWFLKNKLDTEQEE